MFAVPQCVAVYKQETDYLKIECCHPNSHFLVDGAWLCESQRHTSSEMLQAIPPLLIQLKMAPPSHSAIFNPRKIILGSFCFSSPLVY